MFRILISGVLAATIASAAQGAENLALIIANKDYQNYSDARDAFEAAELNAQLVSAGFEVRSIRNMSRDAMEQLAPVIRSEIEDADRIIVFLSGHVFTTSRESWFMATDAKRQDGFLAAAYGLPIGAITDLLAEKAGAAILLVGDPGNHQSMVDGLTHGYVPNGIAQGVTVFTGRTGQLASLLTGQLLVPGVTTLEAAENAPSGVIGYGFLSNTVAFTPTTVGSPQEKPAQVDELEQLIWDNARTAGSEAALLTYLDRFPNGHYVSNANKMLADLAQTPEQLAEDVESALNLNRNERREIQRSLSLLSYNTRGIDGIFGPGTRAAIAAWQKKNRFESTGFFTERQLVVLESKAADRAAQLEEEARKRRAELERQDAEFWRNTGRRGGEAGLRAYVKKYPDGLYSEIAAERLAVFDEERRRTAELEEANAWDVARETGTTAGYQSFLKAYPKGAFAEIAKSKLAALQASQVDPDVAAQERQVMSNQFTRILVEQKLAALDLNPGRVDGVIDRQTRKAIRRFQRAANLPVSGYVTQTTMVRLLAARK